MNNTFKIIISLVIVVVIAYFGYGSLKNKNTIPVPSQPIKVGGIFALSGLGASQGEQELKGVQLAVEEVNKSGGINGRKLELISEDVSLDKLNVAGSAAHKLIDVDKVVAIVGTTWDEPAQAILPIIEASKVPMIGQNQTRTLEKEKSFNYFFSTWHNNEVGIRELLAFAEKKNLKNIAMIRPIAAGFYQYISDTVQTNAKDFNLQIVENVNMNNPVTSDFRTPLTKIKQKNPDAVLIVLNGFTECAFLKQMIELKLNVPVLSTEAAGDYPSLKQCPDLMKNLYFSYPKETAAYQSFQKNYINKFGTKPETPSVMTAYDALKIIAHGLEKTNGLGGEKLQQAIREIKNYKGVSLENISFDDIGYVITPADSFEIKTVINNEFTISQ